MRCHKPHFPFSLFFCFIMWHVSYQEAVWLWKSNNSRMLLVSVPARVRNKPLPIGEGWHRQCIQRYLWGDIPKKNFGSLSVLNIRINYMICAARTRLHCLPSKVFPSYPVFFFLFLLSYHVVWYFSHLLLFSLCKVSFFCFLFLQDSP